MWILLIWRFYVIFEPAFAQNLEFLQYGPQNPSSMQLETYAANAPEINYTTSYGTPVDDPNTVLTVGPDGPMVVDTIFINEVQHLNRESIPLRVVHAKGTGARGTFRLIRDMSQFTRARILTDLGRTTPVLARFSKAFNGIAVPDTRRNSNGFAIKFYTEEGNWDLLTLSQPVFTTRDPFGFISLSHAMKRNPATQLLDATMMWDFFSRSTTTVNSLMYFMADDAIPSSYRHIDGFSANTFALTNGEQSPVFCRFHLISNQGHSYLDDDTALRLEGIDPDYYTRDLYNNIALGRFPSWNVSAQLMSMEEARNLSWNALDSTQAWPESDFPSQTFGILELNENPDNQFAEIEQSSFCPLRLVPGIEPTIDRVLQSRGLAYFDAATYRLGINYDLLPVNRPHVPVGNIRERDGFSRTDSNFGGAPNYYPNSFNGAVPDPRGRLTPVYVPAGNLSRYQPQGDDFFQARAIWQNFNPSQRESFARRVGRALVLADPSVHPRVVQMFGNVSPELADGITQTLNSFNTSE